MFKLAMLKIRREKLWSLVIIGLLIVGFTSLIIIPSIGSSIQRGFSAYSDNVATYIYVSNTGAYPDFYHSRLSQNITNQIAAIPYVENVYPIVKNWTSLINIPMLICAPNGTCWNETGIDDVPSAVIGGQNGYPLSLIDLSAGTFPENGEIGFIINDPELTFIQINQTYTVGFQEPSSNSTEEYVQFDANATGVTVLNPLLHDVTILWNSTLLQQKLGSELYNQTFGGEDANYIIIKVQSIDQVEQVVSQVKEILTNGSYSSYSVVYDQETVENLQSLQYQSAFLYTLIGLISLFSIAAIIFLLTFIFSGRRKWEVGLLVTQGWSWQSVVWLFLTYYLILGTVSAILSLILSLLIANQAAYSFNALGTTVIIPIEVSPILIFLSFIISICIAAFSTFLVVWRMKKMGLDNLLREY